MPAAQGAPRWAQSVQRDISPERGGEGRTTAGSIHLGWTPISDWHHQDYEETNQESAHAFLDYFCSRGYKILIRKGPESIRNRTFETESQRMSRTKIFHQPNHYNRQFSKRNRTEKKNEPFSSVPLWRFFRLSKVLSLRAAVPHWNVHTACHWPGPASGALIKCFPFLFLFILTNCIPTCPCPFPFRFLCFPRHCPFLSLSFSFSFPICVLDCQEKAYWRIAYLTCPFPFPVHCFAFLSFLFLAFLSNMLFGRPGKSIFANRIPSPGFSFSILFLCFHFLFLLSLK